MLTSDRHLEEAADELGRLEATCGHASPAVAIALRVAAVARIAALDASVGRAPSFDQLAAAEGDPLHDAELPAIALHWRTLIDTEERRARGGASITSQRFAIVAPELATYSDRPTLEAIWREAGLARPVLVRALEAAAWSPSDALAEATAALMLCAGGRTDRVRILPFVDIAADERAHAIAAFRTGETEWWTDAALGSVAKHARTVRVAIERIRLAHDAESARLDELGRAAINARRVLAMLRERFVTTMPSLAEDLRLSRPAASDALDRLVAAGIAREVTGRGRDRVYAWGAACDIADAPSAP